MRFLTSHKMKVHYLCHSASAIHRYLALKVLWKLYSDQIFIYSVSCVWFAKLQAGVFFSFKHSENIEKFCYMLGGSSLSVWGKEWHNLLFKLCSPHKSLLSIKGKIKNSSHSWMFLIHVTIPIAEGDWDICFRVDFLLSIASGFPEDFSDGSRYRKGQCLRGITESSMSRTRYPLLSLRCHIKVQNWSIFHLQSRNVSPQPSKVYLSYLVFFIVSDWFWFNISVFIFFPVWTVFVLIFLDCTRILYINGGLFTVIIRTAWYFIGEKTALFSVAYSLMWCKRHITIHMLHVIHGQLYNPQ